MKLLLAAIVTLATIGSLASTAAFADKNGHPAGYGPEWNGQYAPGYGPDFGSDFPKGPTGGKNGKPAGYGPEYTGCVEGTFSTFGYSYHVPGQRDDVNAIVRVVCHNNLWVAAE